MKWYRIDFSRFVYLLIPRIVRKKTLIAWLGSMVFPFNRLQTVFAAYRADIDYKLNHNSQVCYLQAVLNDSFDHIERRIYIADAPIIEWNGFLWDEASDRPIMLGTHFLQGERFIGSDALDFIVYVPLSLRLNDNDKNKMDALLRYYKLAGKRYEIQYF